MGRGKILCYSDLISDLTVYIGVQLRGPSHRGASQPGLPLIYVLFQKIAKYVEGEGTMHTGTMQL